MTLRGDRGPAQPGQPLWNAGSEAFYESWNQAQELWNSLARNWGELAGAWLGQVSTATQAQGLSGESLTVLRELQDAAATAAEAWLRLPLLFVGGTQPAELEEALTRLAQAQGRAYQLWIEAMSRTRQAIPGMAPPPPGSR